MGRRDSWTPAQREALLLAREQDLKRTRKDNMTQENQTPETTGTNPEPQPAVKLTRREKLVVAYNKAFAKHAALEKEIRDIVAEISSIDNQANLQLNSEVLIFIGKGETRKEVEGKIIGVRDEDGAKTFKVSYGSGFDTDVKVVSAAGIRAKPAPAEVAAEQPSE